MAELGVYEYDVNGVKHTAQLDADDAKRYKAKKVQKGQAPRETKQAATPENKGA